MIAVIAATTFALASFSPSTDTTVTVSPGARLVIENFAGEVTVATWSRNAVRIEADHTARTTVEIERDGATLAIKPHGHWGQPSAVDFRITAPASVSLEISGTYLDVTTNGTRGDIAVETVRGDINVSGGSGHIALQSVEGDVTLEGAKGRADLSSVNAGVRVTGHDGDLAAETVNGEIVLENIRGTSVQASTVNGDVLYEGETRSGGRYSFGTHNGDMTVTLPPTASANVAVVTFSGDFYTDFPVKVTSTNRNKRMRFTLGSGGSELELESFQGAIRLLKREASGASKSKMKEKVEKDPKSSDGENIDVDGENIDEGGEE